MNNMTESGYVFMERSFKINQHSLKSRFFISRGCGPSCAMVQVLGTKDGQALGTATCQPHGAFNHKMSMKQPPKDKTVSSEAFYLSHSTAWLLTAGSVSIDQNLTITGQKATNRLKTILGHCLNRFIVSVL